MEQQGDETCESLQKTQTDIETISESITPTEIETGFTKTMIFARCYAMRRCLNQLASLSHGAAFASEEEDTMREADALCQARQDQHLLQTGAISGDNVLEFIDAGFRNLELQEKGLVPKPWEDDAPELLEPDEPSSEPVEPEPGLGSNEAVPEPDESNQAEPSSEQPVPEAPQPEGSKKDTGDKTDKKKVRTRKKQEVSKKPSSKRAPKKATQDGVTKSTNTSGGKTKQGDKKKKTKESQKKTSRKIR